MTKAGEAAENPEDAAKKSRRLPRVAVVAVHGVADQKPKETARAAANLLLSINGPKGEGVRYTPFEEAELQIANRPVKVAEKEPEADAPCDYRFTDRLLREYRTGSEAEYHTVRMVGARRDDDGEPEVEVHVYEVFWADLSRLSSGALRFLNELYQLLFHLGRLGLITLGNARHEQKLKGLGSPAAERGWMGAIAAQKLAVALLTIVIPCLNLMILVSAAAVVALGSANNIGIAAWTIVVAVALLLSAAASMLFRLNRSWPNAATEPTLWAAGGAAAAALLGWTGLQIGGWGWLDLLAVEIGVVAALILPVLARAYEYRHPGAALCMAIMGVLCAVGFALIRIRPAQAGACPDKLPMLAAMNLIEFQYLSLFVCWVAFTAACWVVLAFGLFAAVATPQGNADERRRAWRAWLTAVVSITVPAVLFTVMTLAIWHLLLHAALKAIPEMNYTPRLLTWIGEASSGQERTLGQFAAQLLTETDSSSFAAGIAMMLFAAATLAFAFLPSVLAELGSAACPFPDEGKYDPAASHNAHSSRLGRWLDRAYNWWVPWAIGIFAAIVPGLLTVAFTAYVLDVFKVGPNWLPAPPGEGLRTGVNVLALLATFVAVAIAFDGRAPWLSAGVGSALDVALDVDNYMREYPRNATPRARMLARYASLLRYLCKRTDASGGEYEAIVIVAHSQGTVLTADLLRHLQRVEDESLMELKDGKKLYLFTVGSPLRQLYGRRFPYLYSWAYDDRQGDPKASWKDNDIDPDRLPNREELGVAEWINAYYSGDYVGRYLWRTDGAEYLWHDPVSEDAAVKRREFCLGHGAHTHYFDRTPRGVALEIDRLVMKAATSSASDGRNSPSA